MSWKAGKINEKRMIQFEKFILDNGLRVVIHQDKSTPMAAVNVVYNVGSKHEDPNHTGFAHLFEHLMFGGSKNAPDYDGPIQEAGGENNAFTNSDMTNFYVILPAQNIETALWLESDRMLELAFSKKSLDTQKKVVIEEFKETCLNEPYGDMWHHLSALAYHTHPYQWPTIGRDISHIAEAHLQQVKEFFYGHYRPDNAVLVIAGNVDIQKTYSVVKKWFQDIPRGYVPYPALPSEPLQEGFRQKVVHQDVPHEAVYQAYHMAERMSREYYACDLLSDVLATGRASRFYRYLYKEQPLFSTIDAFISGSTDPGIFVIEGKIMEGVTMEKARKAIREQLDKVCSHCISEKELATLQNRVENNLEFSEVSVMNKALSLSYFEILGDASLINEEADKYLSLTPEDLRSTAEKIFRIDNCSEVLYVKEE